MANEYGGGLTALKARLNIQDDDDSRDDLLTSALAAASRGIEKACGRRFWLDPEPVTRTYGLRGRVMYEDVGELLLTDDIGDVTDMVVETGYGTSFSAVTGYETSPDNALLDDKPVTGLRLVLGVWGIDTTRVRITTRWGWPTVPPEVDEASNIQATRLFKRKDSPEGITGSAEWGVVRLSRRDPDVWNLIEPFILPGFG